MTPERWRQLKEVLEAAWERDASERGTFLDQACANDPLLRSDVEALLASDENASEFRAAPAMRLVDLGEAALARRLRAASERLRQRLQ